MLVNTRVRCLTSRCGMRPCKMRVVPPLVQVQTDGRLFAKSRIVVEATKKTASTITKEAEVVNELTSAKQVSVATSSASDSASAREWINAWRAKQKTTPSAATVSAPSPPTSQPISARKWINAWQAKQQKATKPAKEATPSKKSSSAATPAKPDPPSAYTPSARDWINAWQAKQSKPTPAKPKATDTKTKAPAEPQSKKANPSAPSSPSPSSKSSVEPCKVLPDGVLVFTKDKLDKIQYSDVKLPSK